MQTTAQARPCAPARMPADVRALLARFGLTLPGLLTDDNAKLAKGSAQALPVILHHLPHRALAAALTPETAGIPSRAFIPALRALAEAEGLLAKGLARQGCPWATPGCAMGCLNWAGHGGLSQAVAGDGLNLAQALALPAADGSLALYDYSKAPLQGRTGLLAQRAAGWDVTASLAADRPSAVADAMAAALAGFRLAAPVLLAKGQAWPVALRLTCQGQTVTLPAIAGDDSDNRWLEPQGVAVILRTKVSKGANRAVADPFSLQAVPGPQALADGTAELLWG